MSKLIPQKLSPIEKVSFRGHKIYVKRDDLFIINRNNSVVNHQELSLTGNKARKLHHFFYNHFSEISRIVSFGSVQSNMLYSLAVLAKTKDWALEFYVDHIPRNLKESPRGNYAAALLLGADIREIPKNYFSDNSRVECFVREKVISDSSEVVFIPEGGATSEAEIGLIILAKEIKSWVNESRIDNPKLMLPSGTGTTALFLQKHLPFEVLTCACVGSREYLSMRFSQLEKNHREHPTILPVSTNSKSESKKFQFGSLHKELYLLWQELKAKTEITFDLLYDPVGWVHMLAYLNSLELGKSQSIPTMIYLHQGGLLGNETMLQRYKRKFKM